MPVPDFIVQLRSQIGHAPLWMPGVSVVVFDDAGRILLGRRADNGLWAVISGIPEPGEQPADAVARECREEAGIEVEILGICAVDAVGPIEYPNRDVASYMDTLFVARADAAQAAQVRVADDESTDMGWFHPDELPSEITASSPGRIANALAWIHNPGQGARFTLQGRSYPQ